MHRWKGIKLHWPHYVLPCLSPQQVFLVLSSYQTLSTSFGHLSTVLLSWILTENIGKICYWRRILMSVRFLSTYLTQNTLGIVVSFIFIQKVFKPFVLGIQFFWKTVDHVYNKNDALRHHAFIPVCITFLSLETAPSFSVNQQYGRQGCDQSLSSELWFFHLPVLNGGQPSDGRDSSESFYFMSLHWSKFFKLTFLFSGPC